jgi:acetylxylan esterase
LYKYADKYGFIIIVPATTDSKTRTANCWDKSSKEGLTRDGGGDSTGLVNQVRYVLDKYKADPARVFVTGGSSGGMITNVLLAQYPDVFAGGASFSGGPYAGGVEGIRGAAPGLAGGRPKGTKYMAWHGDKDTVVNVSQFDAELRDWSTVLGVPWTRNETGVPSPNFTKVVYGDGSQVVGYLEAGGVHITKFQDEVVLKFWGLM